MKRKILKGGLLVFILGALFSFTVVEYVLKNETAEVNKVQGYYIYTDCKPVKEYDRVGFINSKRTFSGSGQYTQVRDQIIKNTKKKYPEADGIIISLVDGGTDEAEVIKFK